MAAAMLLAFATMAGTAAADPGPNNGNSIRSQATPVNLEASDVSPHTCQDTEGNDVEYYAIEHGIGEYDQVVWREPARIGGSNFIDTAGGDFDTLYLGVGGPDCPGVQHKGQVSVYYEVDGDWKSIVAQFNAKGELLSVNGIPFEE